MRRFVFVLFLGGVPLCAQQLSAPVSTEDGAVRGEISGSIAVFRGIPYAAPPTDALRWKAAQAPPKRSTTLDATSFGAVCAQLLNDKTVGSEDCLFLNIWAPAIPGSTLRAVMLFLHGGGNISGAASQQIKGAYLFNGLYLAQSDDVVVVTINYRLGPLGFLAHPALTKEDAHHSSGNYGLLDQIAALQWVARNIRNFGGDPLKITIFGQSAGAMDTFKLYESPLAGGVFARAITESGSVFKDQTLAGAESNGIRLSSALGCESVSDPARCLRSRTPAQLLTTIPPDPGGGNGINYDPNIDGYVLPDCTANVLTSRATNPPIILGTNRDDGLGFLGDAPVQTESDFDSVVRATIPGITDAGLAQLKTAFNPTAYSTWHRAAGALSTDFLYLCPARRALALIAPRQPKTFFYQFTHPLDGTTGNDVFHTEELRFVFGTLNDVATVAPSAREEMLANQMMTYWSAFASTGDPNAGAVPNWPAWTPASDINIVLDTPMAMNSFLEKDHCTLIAGVLATQVMDPPPSPCRLVRRRAVRH